MMFTLTGTLRDYTKQPIQGASLTLTPSPARTRDPAADIVYIQGTTVTTDAAGSFTTDLVTLPGLQYTVQGRMFGQFHFDAPEDGTTVDLADVAPAMAPGPYAPYVRGIGVESITDEDRDGTATITYTDGTTSDLPLPNPSEWELHGNGSPEGTVAAPPGTYYTDNAGTTGAWRWLKTTGTSTTGWTVAHGDTGWLRIASWTGGVQDTNDQIGTIDTSAYELIGDGYLDMRRTGDQVLFRSEYAISGGGAIRTTTTAAEPMFTDATILTSGFGNAGWGIMAPVATREPENVRIGAPGSPAVFGIQTPDGPATVRGIQGGYRTLDPWPTELPGVPA